jgi:hypothetical protein
VQISSEYFSNQKISKTVNYSFLFLISVVFVHFDPIGIKITFPFFYLIYLFFSFRLSNTSISYFTLTFPLIFVCIFNFFSTDGVILVDFLKTFFLLIFSLLFHIYFSTCKGFQKFKIDSRYISLLLVIIFTLSFLQFVFFKYGGSTIFFNLFGQFSYANEYSLDAYDSDGSFRVNAFYLEPSYLGFVVINLYLYLYLLRKLRLWHFMLMLITLYLAGSRGGYIFFGLFMLYFSLISSLNSKKRRIAYVLFTLFFLTFLFFSTDSFSILSGNNIVQENTSQYERIYLGYQLAEKILLTYPTGIPLGHIEIYFQKLIGINSSIFSFFFLAIVYFGFIGIILILSIFVLILLKFKYKQFCFIFFYLLMYFNITGSLLAPDTYFWFSIFILLFRNSKTIWDNELM